MQLTYRGNSYQHQSFQSKDANTSAMAYQQYIAAEKPGLSTLKSTPSLEDTSIHLRSPCKYRGVTYPASSPTWIFHKPVVAYKYRGVYYIKGYC